jgi:hypothetical protein
MTVPEYSPDKKPNEIKPISNGAKKRVLVSQADNPHKVMTAGQTILFIFLTLLIGTILNSSNLYNKTSASNPSFTRTVSLAFLKPFDATSRAIGLTSLRQQPRKALDLPRDDKLDTFTFSDSKFVSPPPVPTTLPALSPTNKLSVWIIGDSLSITPSESMQKALSPNRFEIRGALGLVSTGLARPDVFNWFTHINDFVIQYKPKLVIATFGANDDQYLFGGAGAIGPFGSEKWKTEYTNRVSSTLDFLANQGTHTVWVAIPPVRDPARNDRYKIINEVTRSAVSKRKGTASYVETAKAFSNPDGSYSDSLVINGTPTLLRAPDGIHFTRAGGNLITKLVIEKLRTLYSF